MSKKTMHRVALLLVLTAWTALAPLPAAAEGSRRPGPAVVSLWDRAVALLHQWLGWTSVRGEDGSYIDPDGRHLTANPPAPGGYSALRGEDGIMIDPNGGAHP